LIKFGMNMIKTDQEWSTAKKLLDLSTIFVKDQNF